jgi:hypothetical protein
MAKLADYNTTCLICERAIVADRDAVVLCEGEWVHEECGEEANA